MTQVFADREYRIWRAEYQSTWRAREGNRLERAAAKMRAKYLTPRRKAAIDTWKRRKAKA